MTGLAHTHIHAFVYTWHIWEMEDMSAIFIWSHQKNGEKGEVLTKKDPKWVLLILFKSKGCKYCMCSSYRICHDIMGKLLLLVRGKQ